MDAFDSILAEITRSMMEQQEQNFLLDYPKSLSVFNERGFVITEGHSREQLEGRKEL